MCLNPFRFAIQLLSATSKVVTLKYVSKFNPAFFARCVTTILSLPVEFVLTIFRSVPIPYCRRRAMLSCSILSRCSLKRAIVSSQDSNCRPSTFCLCFVRATVRSSETTILYSETNRCPPPRERFYNVVIQPICSFLKPRYITPIIM